MISNKNWEPLNLASSMRTALAELLNHSLASGTCSTYRTVGNMLEKSQEQMGETLDFPLDTRKIIILMHWLFKSRKVTASTANTYLSGLRQMYIIRGFISQSSDLQ